MSIYVAVYRLSPDARLPRYGTEGSTCFDLEYCPVGEIVYGYDQYNHKVERFIDKSTREVIIHPGERLLIPTALVFKMSPPCYGLHRPAQFSIRLHPRSGMALKRGLVLANSEGIVDVDYQEQVFALMVNGSNLTQSIELHERICQAEIVQNQSVTLSEVMEKPTPMFDRVGGFGSTGTK